MGNSFLLIVAGMLIFYLVISDKWKCIEGFAACVTGKTGNQNSNVNFAPSVLPTIPQTPLTLPNLKTLSLNSNWGINNGV